MEEYDLKKKLMNEGPSPDFLTRGEESLRDPKTEYHSLKDLLKEESSKIDER